MFMHNKPLICQTCLVFLREFVPKPMYLGEMQGAVEDMFHLIQASLTAK